MTGCRVWATQAYCAGSTDCTSTAICSSAASAPADARALQARSFHFDAHTCLMARHAASQAVGPATVAAKVFGICKFSASVGNGHCMFSQLLMHNGDRQRKTVDKI